MNDLIVVGLISVGLSVFSILITKLVLDEDKIQEARNRMKENQKKLRSLKPGSKEYNELQDKIIKDSMFVTRESFKPTMYTMIVFMFVLWWLAGHYSYDPISVGNSVFLSVSGSAFVNSTCLNISTKAPVSGEYIVNSKNCTLSVNGNLIKIPVGSTNVTKKDFDGYSVEIKPPKKVFIKLPFSLPFFGDKIGYFGYYLIISLVLSGILNKALKNVRIKFPRKSP